MKKHRSDDIFSTGRRIKGIDRLWRRKIIKMIDHKVKSPKQICPKNKGLR